MIRPAELRDVDALVAIENRCFTTDRLSRRSFRHILTRGHAATLLEEEAGAIRGYVMVLFHVGTSLARLYSIAVAPEWRRRGIGPALIEAAERAAKEEGCVSMRLEIRRDNAASIALFRRFGYRQFGTYADYYEDHMEALRFEKTLVPHLNPDRVNVPYYRQTLDFTCGPAALLMAMKSLKPALEVDRRLELRLWRESTSVFMTSGHGGCGPYGLALSAHRRGFAVEVYVTEESEMFVDSVRSAEKKEVIRLVQEDFIAELEDTGVPVHFRRLGIGEMREAFEDGGLPVVLISSYRIYGEKFPHWVVVTGFDDRFVYVHDPFVDTEKGKSPTDCMCLPILQAEFERMARYGRSGLRAALILRRGEGEKP